MHVVFRIKSLLSRATCEYELFLAGKLMAFYDRAVHKLNNELYCNHPHAWRVNNYLFSILKRENTVRAVFYAAWFSSFGTAIAFFRKNYGKLRTTYITQRPSHFDFSNP